eukprot:TRINITY_DN40875_c0_g1_i1.p1 TRINITY_DN40875_c0_g1~~TRINITY_DN40875_c0_g1_i1.p1  ORF type:complete len:940 (-),score=132.62 TRINITY_DN40875_c0_g1_i1:293-3112(-)
MRRKLVKVYRNTCARVGQRPVPEVCKELFEHGALIVDLQLCTDFEAIVHFLREAPVGLQQLVLYSGDCFFGKVASYKVCLKAARRREPLSIVRDIGRLQQMASSLAVFCSMQGLGLAVLELTGVPLGRDVSFIVPHVGRCLASVPALQRLHLAGCDLRDQGLSILLPHFEKGLPKLSRLSLAGNGLSDLRLLARLLKARSAGQRRRQVVPFSILDLSTNPELVNPASGSEPARCRALPVRFRHRPGMTRRLVNDRSRGRRRGPLLTVICDALRSGLLLRSLRLRSMNLLEEDLLPLLFFLDRAESHIRAGIRVNVPLTEVSLDGNAVECGTAINVALRQLAAQPSVTPAAPCPGIPRGMRDERFSEASWSKSQHRSSFAKSRRAGGLVHFCDQPRPLRGRTQSLPILPGDLERFADEFVPELDRDALSECDAIEDMHDVDELLTSAGRVECKARFEADLRALAPRVESLQYAALRTPPAGCVRISILRAVGLKNLNWIGKAPSCHCEVVPARRKFKAASCETRALANTLEPVWNETHELAPWRPGQSLLFTVRDGSAASCQVVVPSDYFYPDGFSGTLPISGQSRVRLFVKIFPAVPLPSDSQQNYWGGSSATKVRPIQDRRAEPAPESAWYSLDGCKSHEVMSQGARPRSASATCRASTSGGCLIGTISSNLMVDGDVAVGKGDGIRDRCGGKLFDDTCLARRADSAAAVARRPASAQRSGRQSARDGDARVALGGTAIAEAQPNHAKLALLHNILQQGETDRTATDMQRHPQAMPEQVLQYALELMKSDSSLTTTQCVEALSALFPPRQVDPRAMVTHCDESHPSDEAHAWAEAVEANLMDIFRVCGGDVGHIDKRELMSACVQRPGIARFFGIPPFGENDDDETFGLMESLFHALVVDNDQKVSWEEIRNFYWKVCAQRALDVEVSDHSKDNMAST